MRVVGIVSYHIEYVKESFLIIYAKQVPGAAWCRVGGWRAETRVALSMEGRLRWHCSWRRRGGFIARPAPPLPPRGCHDRRASGCAR
jgi:hypothetical protein